MQCIDNTNKMTKVSGLVPNHSASDLQVSSYHLETFESRAKIKWPGMSDSTAWREVDADVSK